MQGGRGAHLAERRRRSRPGFVQNVLWQITLEVHQEGEADVIKEILILWAARVVPVNKTFNEPEKEENFMRKV